MDDRRAHDLADASPNGRDSREAFARSTYAELYRWFHRLGGCPALAADLTQECFASFWSSASRRPAGVSPRTWLYAIGRNLWRNQLRGRRGFEPLEEDRASSPDPGPESRAEADEFATAARAAVDELPIDLREAFTLRFWNEFSYEEIGAIQGITADLARWRYFAARRKLHARLAPWDPNPKPLGKEDRHAR